MQLTKRQQKLPLWMRIELMKGRSEKDLLSFVVFKANVGNN